MSALKYWVWLSGLRLIGSLKLNRLLDYFGSPEGVYSASEKECREAVRLNEKEAAALKDKSFDRSYEIIERCDELSIKIITFTDAMYPDRLKAIASAPPLLYVKGRMPFFDEEIVICMVGSRKATPYGLINAERLAFDLASRGAVILSGMAAGIDTAAHKGALKAGRPTAAVLGNGLDICYPAENRRLMEDIGATGALLSEYPPGTKAFGANFPERNRILSGLSLGTVVVEAPISSGSLITANFALNQGRDVFAVPGNIDASMNEGANSLIKQGAKLVTCANDILEEYETLYPHKLNAAQKGFSAGSEAVKADKAVQSGDEKQKEELKAKFLGLSASELLIAAAVLEENPVHVDMLISKTGLAAGEVLSALTILQLKKIIKQLPGKSFSPYSA